MVSPSGANLSFPKLVALRHCHPVPLFIPEALHRVGQGRLEHVSAHTQEGKCHGQKGCEEEDAGLRSRTVGIVSVPSLEDKIGDGNGHNIDRHDTDQRFLE